MSRGINMSSIRQDFRMAETAILHPEYAIEKGAAVFAACLAIPLLGCVLAVYFKEPGWLVLLAPLIVFMEGAFILGPLAWFVVMALIEARVTTG